ncbi:AI-2E family transporter [Candidatus Thiothrix anitrata]|uniref:AI-2E family transporter n=1 Tax=Candidatus Thiothrix anitrata TaxID=2823902 RepID=A0ABX7X7C0_9GAMM|nr:AI-2E family transporter [Candidatus Thiothrix anitrata]QTR49260.1 AI-2E family transporter [Candidatus Thiothrix anitrata]
MQPTDKPSNTGLVPTPQTLGQTTSMRWDQLLPLFTRLAVWGAFFGLLTLLSSFFTLIFLTFVFAYLQSSIVDMLSRRIRWLRTGLVFLTGGLFLSVIIAVSFFLAPKVYDQATGFVRGFFVYMERVDVELLNLAERYPMLQEAIPELRKPTPPPAQANVVAPPPWAYNAQTGVATLPPEPTAPPRAFADSPSGVLLQMLTGTEKSLDARESVKVVLDQLTTISRQAVGLVSTFLLAVLFSFLIVLDMPRLSNSIRDLRNTRLRFVYDEMADNIYEFGKVLGHTMQAQFYIACVNTLLTAIGLLVLGMGEHIAFLSVIVFLFSFIPVAGVFISSIPICLLALNDGGLSLMALSILMIVFIHMVEGYFLNPMIYGARLRINPVIVLIILTVGGKLFHIWGLILGVPVCTYIFGYAIRYEKPKALGTFKR